MTEEEYRKHLNELLDGVDADTRRRLIGLQWKIDRLRDKYGSNHTGCLIEINKLMFEQVGELQRKFNQLEGLEDIPEELDNKDNILTFKEKDDE